MDNYKKILDNQEEKKLLDCLVFFNSLESQVLSNEINPSTIRELLNITEDNQDDILAYISNQKSNYIQLLHKPVEINLSTIKELCELSSDRVVNELFDDYDINSLEDLPESEYLNFYEDLKNDTQ